ncbi:MAG TPA: cytochrome c3 family protein [Candidatus Polarisedimenticolia bacterium]|nr:cytochrome c3 family protein [Candidatus Polarisedimenticolia bacterium]
MARARTTKTIAKRIDLGYFLRPHPLRTWKGRAGWTAALLSGLAAGWWLLPAQRIAWSAGDLSPAHAFFQHDCASCHGPAREAAAGPAPLGSRGRGMGGVTDAACTTCHAGPAHHARQLQAPTCASCHLEHRGGPLVAVTDDHCASCHAALEVLDGALAVDASVGRFPGEHPEFDPLAAGRDEGRLRLNHKLHLEPGLRGASGPVTLDCAACHQPDAAGALMREVAYEDHCASCHPLAFDTEGRFPPGTVVPHGDPEAARDLLVELYAGAAVQAGGALDEADPVAAALRRHRERTPRLDPPTHVPLSLPARAERPFVTERVALAVRLLERQTCAYCHGAPEEAAAGNASTGTLAASAPSPAGTAALTPPPHVADPRVPAVWMAAASFSHRAHRSLACEACHQEARRSTRTADVLLAGKEACAACHQGGTASAPSSCVTCHRYHPAEEDPLAPGAFTLPDGS